MWLSDQRKYWEGGPPKSLGDAVANEHLGKYDIVCMTDIWVAESQNLMETRQCKYCFLNFSSVNERLSIRMDCCQHP